MGIKARRRLTSLTSKRREVKEGHDTEIANVHPLGSSRPRVERKSGENAVPQLYLLFPSVKYRHKPYRLDVSHLLKAPNLADFLADALLSTLGTQPDPSTAETARSCIVNGIFRYLEEKSLLNLSVHQLDTNTVNSFISWLNSEVNEKARFAKSTRANFYTRFRNGVDNLRDTAKWKDEIPSDLNFKYNPWPGRNNDTNHKATINDDLMTRIRISCVTEVESIINRVNHARDSLRQFRTVTLDLSELFRGAPKRVGYPLTIYFLNRELEDGILPASDALPIAIKTMMRANDVKYEDVAPLFHPGPRELIPFVLLLAIATSYNADVARDLKIQDFRYSDVLRETIAIYPGAASDEEEIALESMDSYEEIELAGFKGRSGMEQKVYLPVDDRVDNPSVIIDFVLDWTKNIRGKCPPDVADRIFIFASSRSKYRVNSFYGSDGTQNATTWGYSLEKFRNEHNLEYFNLDQIRNTILDVTREAFRGDIKASQIQANHKSIKTSHDSYTSDAEERRGYQRLGAITERRTRWRETSGLIDPRDQPEDFDTSCATPGWECLDVYDSPYTPKGKLCSAYGRCPGCCLGKVELSSALSYAYSISLLDAINRARSSMPAEEWAARWKQVRERLLEKWLPSFFATAVKEARSLHIPPMVLPE